MKRTPHERWALGTNEDFAIVDASIRNLLKNVLRYYDETLTKIDPMDAASSKGVDRCFHYIGAHYCSCSVDKNGPRLTVSAIHLDDWIYPNLRFRKDLVKAGHPKTPEVLSRETHDVSNRTRVLDLHASGMRVLRELVDLYVSLHEQLIEMLTIDDVLAAHDTRPMVEEGWWVLVDAERYKRYVGVGRER